MKCYENFSMFDEQSDTPFAYCPDELIPMIETQTKKQNFDVILNKLMNNHELNDIDLQKLSEQQRLILDQVQTKITTKKRRPDQYQKLFYKKAFKFAEKQFFKKNFRNKSRKMSSFYHYHFDKLAQKLNVPLINFYHPDKKTRPGFKAAQKSFNSSYIRLLLRSETFRSCSLQYHTIFKHEYLSERNKKINKFKQHLSKICDEFREDLQKLVEYLQSSKCKIPWDNQEIEVAWLRVGKDLHELNEENEGKTDEAQFQNGEEDRAEIEHYEEELSLSEDE